MSFTFEAILIGLLGSLHCVGMCGPIAVAIPFSNDKKVLGIGAYNFGRVVSYTFLGLIVSIFGNAIPFGDFQRPLSITIGVVFLFMVFVPSLKNKGFLGRHYLQFNSWVLSKMKGKMAAKSTFSKLIFGLLNGFLPCGMVFVALSFSILSPSPILFMLFFGLGTVPSMFLLPFIVNNVPSIRQRISKVFPILMLMFGLLFIIRGMNLGIPYVSPKYSENNKEIKSCCHKEVKVCEKK